jgi:hypothetical protein
VRFKTQKKKKRKNSSNPRKEKTNSSDTETHTSDDSNEAGRWSVGQSVGQPYDVKKTNLKTLTLSGATSTSSVFFPTSRKDLADLHRKKEFSKKLTTKKCNMTQNTSSCDLRETAYQSSGCDTSRANGILGSRSCVVNKCALSADSFLPSHPRSSQSKFARWRVRSRRSVQSSFARCQIRRLRSSDVELSISQSLQDIWTRSASFRFFFFFPPLIFATWLQKEFRNFVEKMRQSRHIFSGIYFSPKIVIYRHLGSNSSPKYSRFFFLFLLSFLPYKQIWLIPLMDHPPIHLEIEKKNTLPKICVRLLA